jgi:acetyl esterase
VRSRSTRGINHCVDANKRLREVGLSLPRRRETRTLAVGVGSLGGDVRRGVVRARLGRIAGTALVALLTLPAHALAHASPIERGVSYGPSPSETATVYTQAAGNATIVILVHGGGWRLQKLATEEGSQSLSLQQRGFAVVDINYDQDSLSEPAFPLESNDVIAATRWAIAHASGYGGNAANVVMLGGSAGGQLVAMAAEQLDGESPGTVRGVVSLSGPMNFTTLVPMAIKGEIKDRSYVLSIGQALGCSGALATCSPSYEAEWSPALHIPAVGCPAWLLVSSEVDPVATRQADEMLTDLQSAACTASHEVVPTGHGFSYWSTVVNQLAAFITAQ